MSSHPAPGLTNRVIGDPEMRRLLVVDDEETIRLAVSKYLRSRGYDVQTANSGPAALEQLEQGRFALMLCDIRMPGLSGLDLVARAQALDMDLAVVMLTAVNDAITAAESLAVGAMDYLTKPVDLADLLLAVERVLLRRDFAVERRNVERLITEEVEHRTTEIERDRAAVLASAVDAISNVVTTYERNDPFLAGTSLRVSMLARAIATQLDLSGEAVEQIAIAARIHDIGKLAIRESVQNKPGVLSTDEFAHVKDHVRCGLEIVAPMTGLREVLRIVRDHHEHWDGSGYAQGIAGEQISLGGRILCAADAFIALTSRRAYRSPMTVEDTLDYLAAHVGGLLDPHVYDALRSVVADQRVLGLTAD